MIHIPYVAGSLHVRGNSADLKTVLLGEKRPFGKSTVYLPVQHSEHIPLRSRRVCFYAVTYDSFI